MLPGVVPVQAYQEVKSPMRRVLLAGVIALALSSPARAAQLDGVTLPDSVAVGSTWLQLNGIALRTFSFLRIPIYVAGLYLSRPERSPDRILDSADTKLLEIVFVHDVSQTQSQAAWRDGFSRNCVAPCRLSPQNLEKFLASVPAEHKGDRYRILFTQAGAEVSANGHSVGTISSPAFAQAMLATFIGPHPPTDRLKQELLGLNRQSSETATMERRQQDPSSRPEGQSLGSGSH
jgi:hypothetical protein